MATSKNLGQFAKRMTLRAKGIGENAEKAVRRAALAADTTVVTTTPFDTGRARGNWLVSIGQPRIEELEVEDPSGAGAIAQGQATIPQWKLGAGPIYIANSLPYIERLDAGYSAQAPRGMTRAAVLAARRQLKSASLLKGGR